MGAGYFFHVGASRVGVAAGWAEVCGLLAGDGSSCEEFSGDGFFVDTGNSVVELFDCRGRVLRNPCFVDRTEKDNAETQRRRRDGGERRRSGGDGENSGLSASCVSSGFSVFVLFDACGFAVSASD